MSNPTIDGVSREDGRHAAVKTLHDIMQSVPSASLYSLAEAVLDAGYAPVAELFEIGEIINQIVTALPVKSSTTHFAPSRKYTLEDAKGHARLAFDRIVELADLQPSSDHLKSRVKKIDIESFKPAAWQYRVSAGPETGWSLWHDGKGDEFRNSYQVENRPLFAAPGVAALQSTIAQLQARIADLSGQLQDVKRERHKAWNERDNANARIAELESGRGEIAGFRYRANGDWEWMDESPFADGRTHYKLGGEELQPLYTAPPAPVAVVLPEFGSTPLDHLRGLLELVVDPGTYPVAVLHNQIRATLATLHDLDATAALNGPTK